MHDRPDPSTRNPRALPPQHRPDFAVPPRRMLHNERLYSFKELLVGNVRRRRLARRERFDDLRFGRCRFVERGCRQIEGC